MDKPLLKPGYWWDAATEQAIPARLARSQIAKRAAHAVKRIKREAQQAAERAAKADDDACTD